MSNQELIEWLEGLHSHTAYGEDTVWEHLQPSDLVTSMHDAGGEGYKILRLQDKSNGYIRFESAGHARQEPQIKGLKPHEFVSNDIYLCGGWQITAAIAQALTGRASQDYGRGGAHRENLQAIVSYLGKVSS